MITDKASPFSVEKPLQPSSVIKKIEYNERNENMPIKKRNPENVLSQK